MVYEWHFGKPKPKFPSVSQALLVNKPTVQAVGFVSRFMGHVTRDPGAGSPENLKTVTSGSLANALCNLVTEQGTEPEMTPPVKCVSGFRSAVMPEIYHFSNSWLMA